jgi:hypothetical protein
LTINTYSQPIGGFDKKPFTADVDRAIYLINSKELTPEEYRTYLGTKLTFFVGETIYSIAYEDTTYVKYTKIFNENGYHMYTTWAKTRNVFLYRRDANGWVKASDTIQSDYYNCESLGVNPKTNVYNNAFLFSTYENNTVEYSQYTFGRVIKLGNGCVVMFMPILHASDRVPNNRSYEYIKIVIFIPKGDGTYNISTFEPVVKNTSRPDLHADHKLEIIENGNSVKAEIWIKSVDVGNEKPDGVLDGNKNGRAAKLPYVNKLFCTLNFDIRNARASYSGDYKLTQIK